MTEDEAARVQREAAQLPTPEQVRELAEAAISRAEHTGLSLDEVRALASKAITQAEAVTTLLHRLHTLLHAETGAQGDASDSQP